MAWEQKPNTGSLFKNDDREEETHPHAKGTALIDGVEYWVSAWTKTTKDGNKWQSLAFKPKEEKKAEKKPERSSFDELEDDLPF